MRLINLKANGIGPLRDVDLDFDSLGPGLVSIVGATGSGKSTLLELTGPALWYRTFAFYGTSVFDHVTTKDAYAEATWENGRTALTFRLVAGRQGKLKEAYLFVDGKAIAGPKLTDYDEQVARFVPDPHLIYSSSYAIQGGTGSFFRIERSLRRTLFANQLGIDRYERWGLEALSRQQHAKSAVDVHAHAVAELCDSMRSRSQAIIEQRDLRYALDSISSQLGPLGEEVKRNEAMLAVARDAVTAAQAQRKAIEVELKQAQDDLMKAQVEMRQLQSAVDVCPQPIEVNLSQIDQEGDAAALEAAREVVAQKSQELETARELHEQVISTLTDLTLKHTNAKKAFEANTRTRQSVISSLLPVAGGIRDINLSIELCRKCPLTEAGRKAQDTITTVTNEQEAERELAEPEISGLQSQLDALGPMSNELGQKVKEANAALNAAQVALQKAGEKHLVTSRAIRDALVSASARGEFERKLAALESIRSHVSEMQKRVSDIVQKQASVYIPLESLTNANEKYESAKRALDISRNLHAEITIKIARVEGVLDMLKHVPEKLASAEDSLRCAEIDLGDWGKLRWACNMLRTLHIDAACPEIGSLASELLSDFLEGRFRLELRTLTEKKSKNDEMKEDFLPIVIDGTSGREADKLSGGETSVCDEALRGALAIYVARHNGLSIKTAARDETAGSLDGDTAQHYVRMLRRMWKISGLYQLLFVSHSNDVYCQADRRIFVNNGRITSIE